MGDIRDHDSAGGGCVALLEVEKLLSEEEELEGFEDD